MNFRNILMISAGLSYILSCSNISEITSKLTYKTSQDINSILDNRKVELYKLLFDLHIDLNEILDKSDIENICKYKDEKECIVLLEEFTKNISDLNLLLNLGLKSSLNIDRTKEEQISIIKYDLNIIKQSLRSIPYNNTNSLILLYQELIKLLKENQKN